MWRKVDEDESLINLAVSFTSNNILYGIWMRYVIKNWQFTMVNNITNPSLNKRAFVGHCAVSAALNIPEHIVRLAWSRLTDNQRILADQQAQNAINEWTEKYENILKNGKTDAIKTAFLMMHQ